jgi:hypothetical protein
MITQAHCQYCNNLLLVEQYTNGRFSVVCTCGFRGPETKSSSEACRVVKKAPPEPSAEPPSERPHPDDVELDRATWADRQSYTEGEEDSDEHGATISPRRNRHGGQ